MQRVFLSGAFATYQVKFGIGLGVRFLDWSPHSGFKKYIVGLGCPGRWTPSLCLA